MQLLIISLMWSLGSLRERFLRLALMANGYDLFLIVALNIES